MVEIDKNIPRPRKRGSQFPWAQMTSGDSVCIPWDDNSRGTTAEENQRRVSTNAREWLRRHRPGWRVRTTREELGIRVWLEAPPDTSPVLDTHISALLDLTNVPAEKRERVKGGIVMLLESAAA